MEREVARYIVRSAFRGAAELQALLPLLKDHASAAEYEAYLAAIARAAATIAEELINPTLAAHPGLADEVDASISTYGRLV